jgi:hypothetical protein
VKPLTLILHVGAVLIGTLAAEAFTRVTIEPDAMFEIAFSMGAQSPHEKYGMTYTPGFAGYMRHPDNVWTVPIRFDEYGFRPKVATPDSDPASRLKVALIGGRSMTMCYGLPDEKTIQTFMVADSERPIEVRNTGWAGIDPWRAWNYYLDTVDRETEFDVALFCINPGQFAPYTALPAALDTVPLHESNEQFFYMLPGNIRMPKDALERWMGPLYFRSYVLFGLLRYRTFVDVDSIRFAASLQQAPGEVDPGAVSPEAETEEGRRRFIDFTTLMNDHFAERDTKFGVVFLASKGHPVNCFDGFDEALPAGIPRLDLQSRLRPSMDPREFIGLGHYNGRQAKMVADELLEFVERLADEGE